MACRAGGTWFHTVAVFDALDVSRSRCSRTHGMDARSR